MSPLLFNGSGPAAVQLPAGIPSTWTVAVSTAFTVPPVTWVSELDPEAVLVTWATTRQPAALQLRSALPLRRNWMSLSTAFSSCLVLRTSSSNSSSTSCWDNALTSMVPSGAGAGAARHRCAVPVPRERVNDACLAVCAPVPSPHADGSGGSDGKDGIPDGIDGIDGREGIEGTGGSEGDPLPAARCPLPAARSSAPAAERPSTRTGHRSEYLPSKQAHRLSRPAVHPSWEAPSPCGSAHRGASARTSLGSGAVTTPTPHPRRPYRPCR